jgi:hypothetical protein
MSIITIKTWLDSGANHQSLYESEFEIEETEWSAMSEEERDEYAKDYAWGRMDWGWVIKEQSA